MTALTRVEQTILANNGTGTPGNCLQAAVASLLSMRLDAVPHFVLFDDWPATLQAWAYQHGIQITTRTTPFSEGSLDMITYIALGKSPRNEGTHAVVWQYGRCIADPHPDQTGIDGLPSLYLTFRRNGVFL